MIADAKTWLPTDDTEARHSIVAGVDPIAAGAPPEQFAADAFGGRFADPDTEVPMAALCRLAERSGQSAVSLAAGSLTATEPITGADVAQDLLL